MTARDRDGYRRPRTLAPIAVVVAVAFVAVFSPVGVTDGGDELRVSAPTRGTAGAVADSGVPNGATGVPAGRLGDAFAPPNVRLTLDWPGKDAGQGYVLPGDRVVFDASESSDPDGDIETYAFDVDGDGDYERTGSTDPVYEDTYETEGYTSAVVRVTDSEGNTNTTFRQVFVNAPPVARFQYGPSTPSAGETVRFDGRASSDYNGSITRYEWVVDGTLEATGPTFNRSFGSPGEYEVTLVVYDDEDGGPSNRTTRFVTVGERDQPPEANLTISPRPATAGAETTLDASNSTDPDGRIVYYLWDFDGDGAIDENTTDAVTTYRFAYDETGEGYAVVELTVVDDAGNRGRAGSDLRIRREGPVARCTLEPGAVAVDETAVLNASASENAGSYVFDVDADPAYDTDRYVDPRFQVSFAESGNYTLGVRAYGNDTDRTNETDCVLRVSERPRALFTVSPRPATAGAETTLDASNSTDPDGRIAYYLWDFDGDGTVDENTTDPVTTHRFAYDETGEGYAVVELDVVDDAGVIDENDTDLEVLRPELEATCTVSPRSVAPGEDVTLAVDPGPDVDSFQYDSDSTGSLGSFTDDSRITVQYDSTGVYAPRVRVWNSSTERSRLLECDTVTVEAANAPPDATFTVQPGSPETGESVTVDAAGATDPDGRVVRYEWDFDGDGTYETSGTGPTATTSFPDAGNYTVRLRVEDDDGATDTTQRTVRVLGPLRAECGLSTRTVAPGETVSLSVERGDGVDAYQFDRGDGAFGDFVEEPTASLSYDDPGNYTPRVRVWAYPSERSLVVECGTVRVRTENAPPVAVFGFTPSDPTSNDTVTFDASNSTDPDGRIVRYEWDFDDDGTVDATTDGPTVTHTYPSEGNRTARLVVVDDRNASAAAENTIPVVDPSPWPGLPDWWWILPLFVGGAGAAGWGLRKIPKHLPKGGSDTGREYAMGTFETPGGSETVSITGVGFEPDVVVLRAANQVRSPPHTRREDESGDTPSGVAAEGKATGGDADGGTADDPESDHTTRSAGLSIGSAVRRGDDLEQSVVSVADDAESVDAAVGATHSGKAVDVLVHGDDHVGSLAGAVRRFTDDGFEVAFDADELPAGEDGGYVVHYQAFALDDPGSLDVGHFATPTGTGTQTVELGTDADYVALTACSLPETVDSAATGPAVGISHGEAVAPPEDVDEERSTPRRRVQQGAVGGAVAAGGDAPGLLCGHDDRALHLPFLDGDGVVGHTAARVRELGERLELTYDAVHAPEGTTRVVTYLAMDTGDALRPELGHVRVPAPGATRAVDVGFDPGMVSLTGIDVDRVNVDAVVPNAVPFDWSYGVAMPTVGGETAEQVLHGSLITRPVPHPPLPGLGAIDPVHAGVTAGTGTPIAADAGDSTVPSLSSVDPASSGAPSASPSSTGGAGRTEADADGDATSGAGDGPTSDAGGDHSGPSDLPSGRGAAAVVLSTGDAGEIRGRDEVSVSAFTDTGFEVRTGHARSHLDERPEERRGVLFYTAWPKPTPGPNRRTNDPDAGSDADGGGRS